MFKQSTLMRTLMVAIGLSISVSTWAASYTLNFDALAAGSNANADMVAQANGVSFASSYKDDILDASFNVIGQHWLAYNDAVDQLGIDPAIFVREPSPIGWGTAPSGANALDARFDQVMLHFAVPTQLTHFSIALAQGGYAGYLGSSNLLFLDANGVQIAQSADFNQATDLGVSVDFVTPTIVSAVVLPAGKFYDTLSVSAVPVPEAETYAMMLAGLSLVGTMVRRRFC